MTATTTGRALRALSLGTATVLLAGCSFGGLNSLNMPGTKGHGSDAFTVTVELPDVLTLPQNSPVMVDDVTVGSISGIDAMQRPDGTFYAAVQVSLEPHVDLPANTVAKVAQTSLLGSQHLELAAPTGEPAEGQLTEGSHIPLSQTGRYPSTEEVLSSLGVVVNKGNLGAVQDITEEMYAAVADRSGSLVGLVPRLAELTHSLRNQTDDIITAMEGMNRLAGTLANSQESLGRTLETLPAALEVLNNNRANIVEAITALGRVGTVAADVLSRSKDDFVASFKDLYPVVRALAENADDVVTIFPFLATFPFHSRYLRSAVRGDYLNVYATFDMTLRRLGETIFTTSGLDPNMHHMAEIVNPPDFLIGSLANLSGQAADPFEIPPGDVPGKEGPR